MLSKQLKERNGSRFVTFLAPTLINHKLTSHSRQAITKYIKANNKLGTSTDAAITSHINTALRAGETSGDFLRPKGSSGTVKLANKNAAAKPAAPKPTAKAPATETKAKVE